MPSLPAVEQALQALAGQGRSGKTLHHYAAALTAFYAWCVERAYLPTHPLRRLAALDLTPRTRRRALTPAEIHRLLAVCPPHHRLLYETACLTGLRASELRHLTLDHLDLDHGGLRLDAAWTKNRQPGFQPLPRALVGRLYTFATSGAPQRLYDRAYQRRTARWTPPAVPLLVVPQSPVRTLDAALRAAGIPKVTREGKVDFHALRVAYVTLVFEGGATAPEARALARHHHPELTLGVYARTREPRLQELIEGVAALVLPETQRAPGVHAQAVGEAEGARTQGDTEPWAEAYVLRSQSYL